MDTNPAPPTATLGELLDWLVNVSRDATSGYTERAAARKAVAEYVERQLESTAVLAQRAIDGRDATVKALIAERDEHEAALTADVERLTVDALTLEEAQQMLDRKGLVTSVYAKIRRIAARTTEPSNE